MRAAMGRRQPWALDTLVMGQELQDCSKPLFAEVSHGADCCGLDACLLRQRCSLQYTVYAPS